METVNQYRSHFISVDTIARDALKILDQLPDNEIRTLLVLDGNRLVGTLTDGDIRRGLLLDREISEKVSLYMNRNFKSLQKDQINPQSLAGFREREIWFIPVVNEHFAVEQIINLKNLRTVIPASAMIMAGGRGERLRPMTDTLPKPLLKVGDKPIIEWNIDRLIKFGITKFYISIRYLGDAIIDYFGDGTNKNVSIEYIREDEPLGTLGSCSHINEQGYKHLLVMNSDLLTNIDFEDFFNFYMSTRSQMAVASIPYKVNIPYGIMKLNDDDIVTGLEEKPTYTYYANAGIYMINENLIDRIPKNQFYNATDLMQHLIDHSGKLVHYPILQYWLDIGKYEDYNRAQQDYKHIVF